MIEDPPTLIIDSSYIGYQALYVQGKLTHEGAGTGVMFGFLSRMLSLGQMFRTNDIVFCFDSRHSFRKDLFPDYKAQRHNRELTDEELIERQVMHQQMIQLKTEVLPAIGFKNIKLQPGLESDDLIAELTDGKIGDFVIIASDKDLYQCLRFSNVKMFNPTTKKMITKSTVLEETGLKANVWAEMKTVVGCATDNVPGTPGVAMKTFVSYADGKMNKASKKYAAIEEFKSSPEYARNKALVSLPHTSTAKVNLTFNEFSEKGLIMVCNKYGMDSFLNRMDEWREFFRYGQQQ